jgi:hypothetical protein
MPASLQERRSIEQTRTGQVVRNKSSTTPYCITKDTHPAGAAGYGSSSLMRATQGTLIEDTGGT